MWGLWGRHDDVRIYAYMDFFKHTFQIRFPHPPPSIPRSEEEKKNMITESQRDSHPRPHVAPVTARVRQIFYTVWSAASHYTPQLNWLCCPPIVRIQEEASTEEISCVFAITSHRGSRTDLCGQTVPTPVQRRGITQQSLVIQKEPRCFWRPASHTLILTSCFCFASNRF